MAVIHELYGILAEERERLQLEYQRLLNVLSMVKDGDIDIERVTVTSNAWEIKPLEEVNEEP